MPTKIQIHDPVSGPRSIWVEKPYLKFGADPSCDLIVMENIEAQGSVRFKEGQYWLFNDSAAAMTLAGRPVERGTTHAWTHGERVRFPDGIEFLLIVEGDPAPARRSVERTITAPPPARSPEIGLEVEANAAPAEPASTDSRKGVSSTEVMQLGVTLLCIAAFVSFMVIGVRNKNTRKDAGADEFSSLVELGLSDQTPSASNMHPALVRRLQMAEGAIRHGNVTVGLEQFRQLKTYLDDQSAGTSWPNKLEAFEVRLRTFVSQRLAEVNEP